MTPPQTQTRPRTLPHTRRPADRPGRSLPPSNHSAPYRRASAARDRPRWDKPPSSSRWAVSIRGGSSTWPSTRVCPTACSFACWPASRCSPSGLVRQLEGCALVGQSMGCAVEGRKPVQEPQRTPTDANCHPIAFTTPPPVHLLPPPLSAKDRPQLSPDPSPSISLSWFPALSIAILSSSILVHDSRSQLRRSQAITLALT